MLLMSFRVDYFKNTGSLCGVLRISLDTFETHNLSAINVAFCSQKTIVNHSVFVFFHGIRYCIVK